MTDKPKSTGKPKKKSPAKQQHRPLLSEDILSNVGAGIYIVQHGKFVYANPLFQIYSGYSDTEIMGQNRLDYIHPDDRDVVGERAAKNLKSINFDSYEYRFIRK